MPTYSVTTDASQDEVLQWEAGNVGQVASVLVQSVIERFLAERKGHFNDPRERLRRLSPADIAQIPPPIRAKLGI